MVPLLLAVAMLNGWLPVWLAMFFFLAYKVLR
jgi:hypothetical protein